MNLIEKLKGVFRNMISPKTVSDVLGITPAISDTMKNAIELWENVYTNHAPWITDDVHSLGIGAMVASEKARTATIEMEVKITGETDRAEFIANNFKKVLGNIRENLEFGIALGSLVIKPYVVKGVDDKYTIMFSYCKATDFYPLSFSANGSISEAAFRETITRRDTIYTKLEYHKLENNNLIVKNMAYESSSATLLNVPTSVEVLGKPIPLTAVPEWADLEPEIVIENIDHMLFAYFKMPIANNVDINSPLGISGFSRAIDVIRDADEQYGNLLWEFYGGQLAIDVDRTALNPLKTPEGKMKEILPRLQDRLFRRNLDLGSDDMYNVFSPSLRDDSIINGLNTMLMKIEDLCDLSRGALSTILYSEARTATELKILKQRSFSANTDIQKELQTTLECVINIMNTYCDLYDIVPEGDYEVAFKWDDSIIVDKDAERQQDLIEVEKGLMSKVEYRMKWYGETENQAEDSLKRIQEEKTTEIENTQAAIASNQTPLERANESGEVTQLQDDKEAGKKKKS